MSPSPCKRFFFSSPREMKLAKCDFPVCSGLDLAKDQMSTQLLNHSQMLSGRGEENRTKSSWFEIQTGRFLNL